MKRPTLPPITIRINNKLIREWVTECFGTLSGGAATIVMANHRLYGLTLMEIAGKFSAEELLTILEAAEHLESAGQAAGAELTGRMIDTLILGQLGEEAASKQLLLGKLRRLTVYQAATLQWWASMYWIKIYAGQAVGKTEYTAGLRNNKDDDGAELFVKPV